MKRVMKIFLALIVAIIVFAVGFILVLQIFEYRPEQTTELEIVDNLADVSTNYVDLDSPISILSFNTGYASLSETEDFVMDGGVKGRMDTAEEVEANMEGIASILERENTDIYLLQEVDMDSARSYGFNQYEYYRETVSTSSMLAYNYRCIFVPFPFNPSQMFGKVNSGVATYSNYYSTDASREQLPGSFSWPLRIANLKRCILISRYPINGSEKELVVINVHLSAYDDGSMRAEETAFLQEIMNDEFVAGNYVVVGGDFNQTLPGAVTTQIDMGSGDVTYEYLYELHDETFWQAPPLDSDWMESNGFQFGVDTTTPTCRLLNHPYDSLDMDNNQFYLIDGFIVSENVSIQSVVTLNESFEYSDHNPVRMVFVLNS